MRTDEFVRRLQGRGLAIGLREDGSPVLRGDKAEVTGALMRALRWHREEIVRRLRDEPVVPAIIPPPPAEPTAPPVLRLREWLWRCTDGVGPIPATHRYLECPEDASAGNENAHPCGSWWWRWQDEEGRWRIVPGREEAKA